MPEIIDVCPTTELGPGQMRLVEWDDLEIGVFNCNGEVLAMEERSHRLVNRLVGNDVKAAALECTFSGPVLRFLEDSLIALGGAQMDATLDAKPVPYWQTVEVREPVSVQPGVLALNSPSLTAVSVLLVT